MVRFSAPIQDFEGYIEGTCELLKIAASSSNGAQFIYTSSTGVAQLWNTDKFGFAIPEDAHQYPEASCVIGYTESKYVMEHVRLLEITPTSDHLLLTYGPRFCPEQLKWVIGHPCYDSVRSVAQR